MNDKLLLNEKEDIVITEQSKSRIFFALFIFFIGLVLGYLLKYTFLSSLIHDWIFCIWEKYIPLSREYFYFLYYSLQKIIKYFWLLIFL